MPVSSADDLVQERCEVVQLLLFLTCRPLVGPLLFSLVCWRPSGHWVCGTHRGKLNLQGRSRVYASVPPDLLSQVAVSQSNMK